MKKVVSSSKMLSIRDIQDVSLGILIHLHDFCLEKGIRYSLFYGTLLGAVRHKGFIPWDDDIDIVMPRTDFDRFLCEFSFPGLEVSSPYDGDSYIAYARVFDTEKTFSINTLPYAKKGNGGVWVDIFPVDGVEDDPMFFEEKAAKEEELFGKQIFFREPKAFVSSMPNIKKKVGLFLRKIVRKNGLGLNSINQEITRLASSVPFGSTDHWSQLVCSDRSRYRMEDFHHLVQLEFEGHEFMALNGFDACLRACYGDYMQLPPENERVPHSSNVTFYWK